MVKSKMGEKGLIRVLEVFLAIQLMAVFLASVQLSTTPSKFDPHNLRRLKSNSEHMALSICNNDFLRRNITENGSLPDINVGSQMPKDLGHLERLYNGSEFSNLVDEDGNYTGRNTMVPSGCVIIGHTQKTLTKSTPPVSCSQGSSCVDKTNESDNNYLNLSSGENITLNFSISQHERGFENILSIEANQNGSGSTSILVQNETEKTNVTTMSFSSTGEVKTANLTDYLPDAEDVYNITIKQDIDTSYDYIELNVTRVRTHYNPYKVISGVWNK